MALFQSHVYSNTLQMEFSFNVLIPQNTNKKIGENTKGQTTDIPVLYLLHGMGGNENVWLRKTSIERYANEHSLAVVMPATSHGWYTDTTYDMKYWTFLSEELPELLEQFFPQLTTKREKTYVAGLSMGGFGAMKLGLLRPERFSKVIALSAPLVLIGMKEEMLKIRNASYWEGIFGPFEKMATSINNPKMWLENFSAKEKPAIFLACGTEDPLLGASLYYGKKLTEAGFQTEIFQGTGAHEWSFWDEWIKKAIQWLEI